MSKSTTCFITEFPVNTPMLVRFHKTKRIRRGYIKKSDDTNFLFYDVLQKESTQVWARYSLDEMWLVGDVNQKIEFTQLQ
jgi:hypothetical protein